MRVTAAKTRRSNLPYMEEETTDPAMNLFSITGQAFNRKIARVREISDYLAELPPVDRDAEQWRLADALHEALTVGWDLHRVVCDQVSALDPLPAEEPTLVEVDRDPETR